MPSKVDFPIQVPDPRHVPTILIRGNEEQMPAEGLQRQIEKVAAPGSSTNDDSLTRDPGPIFKLDARDVI